MRRWWFAILLVPALTSADQYDDAITTLKRGGESKAFNLLRMGPPEVDRKILDYFDQLGKGYGTLPREQLQRFMQILEERYYDRVDQRSRTPHDSKEDLANVVIVLRLQARHPVYAGAYLYRRGPKFYLLLLDLAKGGDPDLARSAQWVLRDTVMSRRADNLPGDPALIRLFRRTQEWNILGVLRDRASIPAMRKAMRSPIRETVVRAMAGLSKVPDYDGPPLYIPHLADPEEVKAADQEGKFGTAYWCLRRGMDRKHVSVLVRFAKEHSGVPRAYAVNLVGYFGSKNHVAWLNGLTKDPHPRVQAASINAIRRLSGKLPDPHDVPRWTHP